MILVYEGKQPNIEEGVFIAPNATIIGDVTIKSGASVWYGAVVRGDMEPIIIGENTNIQDHCTVHTDYGHPAVIGDNVSVGHNAIIHGCTIENDCLIGMNAAVLNGAHIREFSLVAAGSVVREGQTIGPLQLAAGVPAIVKKTVNKEMISVLNRTVANYRVLSKGHSRLHRHEQQVLPKGD